MASKLKPKQIDTLNQKAWEELIHDPKKGLEMSLEAAEQAEKIGYEEGIAEAALNIGWCYSYLSDSKQALKHLTKSDSIFNKTGNDEGSMKALNAVGVVYHNLSQYDLALKYYTKSLALSRKTGNTERELAAMNNLGEFYHEIGSNKQALEFFSASLKLAEELNDLERLASVLVNMGLTKQVLGDNQAAEEYLERAIRECLVMNDQITLVRCYTAMGRLCAVKSSFDEAAELYGKGIEIAESTGNRLGELEAKFDLAKLYEKTAGEDECLGLLLECLSLGQAIESKYYIYQIQLTIAKFYERKKDFEKALRHYKNYSVVEKEVFSEEAKARLENLITHHEIERSSKEAEIYKLKNIELKQKTKEAEDALRRLAIIIEIGQKTTASLDIETIMFTTYESVNRLMPAEVFGIALYDKETSEIEYRLFIENSKRLQLSRRNLDPDNSFASWCIVHKQEVFLGNNTEEYIRYLPNRARHFGKPGESIIYIPLIIKNEIIGVLTVQSFTKYAFTPDHLEILKTFSPYLAVALENSLIHEKVSKLNSMLLSEKNELEEANKKIVYMANHDNLTSLANRRLLSGIIEQIIPHSIRNNKQFALFYIDLDNFKPINDQFGHDVGDELLRITADRLHHAFRESDTIARIGGDEFVAIIRDLDKIESVERVAKKVLKGLRAPATVLGHHCSISVSIGISVFPKNGKTLDILMQKADRAMYRVKDSGKDGYKFYQEEENN